MMPRQLRKQIADLGAVLAARLEFPLRFLEEALELAELALPVIDRDRLAGVGEQLRLGIEGIDVRDAAGHVQEDDALRPGAKCGGSGASGSRAVAALADSASRPRRAMAAKPPAARCSSDRRDRGKARMSTGGNLSVLKRQGPDVGVPALAGFRRTEDRLKPVLQQGDPRRQTPQSTYRNSLRANNVRARAAQANSSRCPAGTPLRLCSLAIFPEKRLIAWLPPARSRPAQRHQVGQPQAVLVAGPVDPQLPEQGQRPARGQTDR